MFPQNVYNTYVNILYLTENMSEVVHTCFIPEGSTSPMYINELPECNENCQDVKIDDIKTLNDEDKQMYKNDISKTSYLNEMSSSNLYEDMLMNFSDDANEVFNSDEDDFFIEFNDNSETEYKSQRSINLLHAENKSDIDIENNKSTSSIERYNNISGDKKKEHTIIECGSSSSENSESDLEPQAAIQTDQTLVVESDIQPDQTYQGN